MSYTKYRVPVYLPWDESNNNWKQLYNIYNDMANEMYENKDYCQSFNITTTFGSTFGYACGNPTNTPIFMFHGGMHLQMKGKKYC